MKKACTIGGSCGGKWAYYFDDRDGPAWVKGIRKSARDGKPEPTFKFFGTPAEVALLLTPKEQATVRAWAKREGVKITFVAPESYGLGEPCPLCEDEVEDVREHLEDAHEHEVAQRKKNPKDPLIQEYFGTRACIIDKKGKRYCGTLV